MKRTFVLLTTVLTQPQYTYAQTDALTLDNTIPVESTDTSNYSDLPSATQNNKSDPLLYAQLKVRQGILLASEMTGRLNRLKLRTGQHFIAGQKLADFNCPQEQAQLTVVQTSLNKQEQLKQELEVSYSINTLEIDLVNAAYEEANANVHVAEAVLSRCTVYAPFSGKVVKFFAKSAQTVRAGDPLMEIIDDNNQEVEVLVPAREFSHIAVGQQYHVNRDNAAKPYTIEITNLGGRIDPISQTIKMYGRIAEASLPINGSHLALVSQKN